MDRLKEDALEYHKRGRPGKIEVKATKPLATQRDLSLAYSPGVAEPVLAIYEDPLQVYELTAKGNLVAVVSNGTAILGLGNKGPMASKPVMEGKGVLFKRFADIDVFDIEIDATTPEEIIAAVKAIAPTFGGINLEDIKAPEAFIVEETLKRELDIPVFHDDQHGTAIISGAALLNACEIVGKKLEDLKIVVSGAGASAIATGEFYVTLGVKRENIIMCDSKGVLYKGRDGLNQWKERFAVDTHKRTLADACIGADVFLGLSAAGVLTQDMVKTMAENPIIFALANPTPEIMPEEALEVRPDAIMATGRSDYPNQVNNVLGFPFLFRGALDVYATEINEDMKMAAAMALAHLAKEDVPDSMLNAYGLKSMKFSREYLIPKPLDNRVLLWVSTAVAEAAMKSGVARREIDLEAYREELFRRQGGTQHFRQSIISQARAGAKQRIVFPEGQESKIIRAALMVQEEGIGHPILLGDEDQIRAIIAELGIAFSPDVVNPNKFDKIDEYAETLYQDRRRKGVTPVRARSMLQNVNVFAPMMVKMGDADAVVSGVTSEYPEVIRPALQILGTDEDVHTASGIYIAIVDNRILFLTDTTINIDPDAETLAHVAVLAARFADSLNFDPRIAMLSFSNFGSVRHPLSDKVRKATDLLRAEYPELSVDGEMQADTAVVEAIMQERFPFSSVENPNILVFPDLGSANIAYKLLDRLTEADVIGPVLQGVGGAIQVLQAGDDVDAIVALTAFAAIDAQNRA